jgi:N-acetylglucosamine-6-sulfatase
MRTVLRLATIAVLALHVACGGGNSGSDAPPPDQQPPNIVFILTDDQALADLAVMPNVNALIAAQGRTFANHYVTLSLCCPSRVTALRGQFSHNTTIFDNSAPDGGFEAVYSKGLEQSTVATWLSAAGYRTAMIGKYLNGYPDTAPTATYIPPGWTEWVSPIDGFPYKAYNYTLNVNGTTVVHGETEADYLTDVLSAKAVDFITRSIDQHPGQPFFLYLASFAPHGPATPAPRHANLFPGAQVPRTASFNEADVSDKPAWVQAQPLLTEAQIAEMDALYRKRLQSLQAVDEMVKAVIDTLQAKGQLANTYIFFTSDNGFHQGQHRLESGKMTAFEEDLRVPLVVRGPGVAAGSTTTAMTANVDYAPTFAEIGGVTAPGFVDGRSLMPMLKGQTPADWRQALLLEHKTVKANDDQQLASDGTREPADPFDKVVGAGDDRPNIAPFSGLRTVDGTTYIEYEDGGGFEMYDNKTDPAQLTNIYNAAPADVKARLSGWLSDLKGASGTRLRQAEQIAP